MMYKRPWCLLCPSNYSMSPVSVHMSITIYNSVQEDLIFVVTKKKQKQQAYFRKNIHFFHALIVLCYYQKPIWISCFKKCCRYDVYLWQSRSHMWPNEYWSILLKNHNLINWMHVRKNNSCQNLKIYIFCLNFCLWGGYVCFLLYGECGETLT